MGHVPTLNKIIALSASALLVLMMVHVTADVLARNLLSWSAPGTLEIVSMYYMPAIVFLPLAYVESLDEHIHVDLVYNLLPRVLRFALVPAALLLASVIYGVMAWGALEVAIEKYRIGEYIMGFAEIVVWPGRFFVPIGLGALSLTVLLKALVFIRHPVLPNEDAPQSLTS